jgi:hypothetical protein
VGGGGGEGKGAGVSRARSGATSHRANHRAIRGLGLRLRLCARYGLMHSSGVFKVYAPPHTAIASTAAG